MALPDEFWKRNEFGVRGGVECGHMSTTLDRNVAMGYASGDKAKTGIVIECQQGMVNRGADISWLSQYPHEAEILFGPLTGIEVLNTHIDVSVVVIECAFSVNLSALTLEQVRLLPIHSTPTDSPNRRKLQPSRARLAELRRGQEAAQQVHERSALSPAIY